MQDLLVPLWVRRKGQNVVESGLLMALAIGIGASYARAQAVVEYGNATSAVAGAASSALKAAMPAAGLWRRVRRKPWPNAPPVTPANT